MRVNAGLCRGVAIAVLSMSAIVWLPPAASAAPSLSVTASSSPDSAYSEVTFFASGTADKRASLELYAVRASDGDCPATAEAADSPEAAQYVVAAGAFSQSGGISVDPGTYIVCGYLVNLSGSRSEPPAAAATSATVTVQDGTGTCPTDLALTVSHISFHAIGAQQSYSGADITVHTSASGTVDAAPTDESNHNLGSGRGTSEGSDNYVVEIYDTFNRSRSHADTAGWDISFEPDADLGCTSTPQKLTVTFYADTTAYNAATQGGGGVAAFRGQLVPGSEPTIPDPSPSPKVGGPVRVGSTAVCSLSVPRGNYVAAYGWYAAGAKVGTGASYRIAPADAGKPLRCVVIVSSDDGKTTSHGASANATVKNGPAVKSVLRPEILGNSTVGHTMHVVSKASFWSPKPTSYTYQWYAGSKRIAGATGKRYRIAAKVSGKRLYCRVTAHAAGYAPGHAITFSRDIP